MKNVAKQAWKNAGITLKIFLACFFVYFTCYTCK